MDRLTQRNGWLVAHSRAPIRLRVSARRRVSPRRRGRACFGLSLRLPGRTAMKPSAVRWLTACALVLACGGQTAQVLPPTGQIKLYVTTDAPLPAAPGEAVDPNEPPAL